MDEPAAATIFRDPPQTFRLHGRDHDLARIRALLDAGHVRLLTLTGPGGVGKTRLAEAVVASIAGDYADGAVTVSLAPLQEAGQVLPAIARACGLPDRGDAERFTRLASELRPRHLLLFLDNFEHLLEPAPSWLGEMLQTCLRLTVLVTSRVPLHLKDEYRYPVAPLAVPEIGEPGTTPAETLFVDRARAVRPEFTPDDRNREAVAAICRQLDGLPLALELAAARTAALSPEDLLARMPDRPDLLAGGPRDAPQRQQSLRATIAWSYDLLPTEHQRLFSQLAVFRGGFTLAAAEAVCGPPTGPIADVLNGVAALVDHSLVQAQPMPDGTTRYRMLETIRQFAAWALIQAGDERTVRERHADWCMSLIDEERCRFDATYQVPLVASIEPEHDNVRAALAWLDASSRAGDLARLVTNLRWFWQFGGHEAEGLAWYRRLIANPVSLDPMVYADAVRFAGQLAQVLGDPGAQSLLDEALALAQESKTAIRIAEAHYFLGTLNEDRGDYARAASALERARTYWQLCGEPTYMNSVDYHLGIVALGQGDHDRAVALLERANEVAAALGEPLVQLWSTFYLGLIACEHGDTVRSASLIRVLLAATNPAFHHQRADTLALVALFAHTLGRREVSARCFGAADAARHGVPATPPERDLFDRAVGSLRHNLGEQAFRHAWESGRRMRHDEIRATFDELTTRDPDWPSDNPEPASGLDMLSPREREVLALLAQGQTNQEIADALFISVRTVASHVANILTKLDVSSRTAAVAWAIRNGLA